MHDRVDVRLGTIDPQMETIRWIRHALAFEDIEIIVYEEKIFCSDLFHAEAKAQHVIGAGLRSARGQLARETGIVTISRQNPGRQRKFLTIRPFRNDEMLVHALGGLFVILGFVSYNHVHWDILRSNDTFLSDMTHHVTHLIASIPGCEAGHSTLATALRPIAEAAAISTGDSGMAYPATW